MEKRFNRDSNLGSLFFGVLGFGLCLKSLSGFKSKGRSVKVSYIPVVALGAGTIYSIKSFRWFVV